MAYIFAAIQGPNSVIENIVAEHVPIACERRGYGKPLSGRVGIF